METETSCVSGFFMAVLLLQIIQAMSLNIEINIQVPDGEGVLVECTSESLILPTEMAWRDSKGNIIPHSSKSDSEDRAGLMHVKSSILLKNRTEGPITCSIYNVITNQEEKRSIVLPASLLDNAYPLYSNWLMDVCTILVVMMVFFTLTILLLLCTLMRPQNQNAQRPEDESVPLQIFPQDSIQRRSPVLVHRSCREENFYFREICVEENFQQPQGSSEEDIFLPEEENCGKEINFLQPRRLHCSFN